MERDEKFYEDESLTEGVKVLEQEILKNTGIPIRTGEILVFKNRYIKNSGPETIYVNDNIWRELAQDLGSDNS